MSASSSARPQVMLNVLRNIRSPLLLLLLLTLSGSLAYAQVPDPISGIDDTPNTQWRATTANNAGFGVANVTESSQPYTHTTDGQSIRFDLFCASSPCSYGYTHMYNPSYGTSSATDAATSFTNDLLAELDSVGVAASQALEFGLDQSMCTANCGTGSDQYTRFRYAMQCDFKGSGKWRVWDANSAWVATSHSCVAFTSLQFVHFTFHYSRPDTSHVTYTDIVINGTTYPINMTQAAQSLGSAATHEFIPWVNLDGDSATDPYSMWVDQWSINYSGGSTNGLIVTPPSNAVVFSNLDDDPISSDPTNPPQGQWGQCVTSDCGKPANQTSFTHTTASGKTLDGQALDAFNSGGAYWGVLYYHKNGQQDFASNYEVQWKFMTDTAWSNVQALEFDFPVSVGGRWFYFGTQCDRISGQWQYWNPNSTNHGWNNSGVTCNGFAPNVYHTLVWYGTRDASTLTFTYNALEVDGVITNVNITLPAPTTIWGDDFIVQFQPDGDSAGTGYNLYVDEVDAWVW